MSESVRVELGKDVPEYIVNSVPCKIRFTGRHEGISDHLHKLDSESHIVTYLRGRKLNGQELKLKGLTGHLLTKEFDDVKTIGKVGQTIWFEREGHTIEVIDKINEGIDLSELIHG